MFVDIGNVKDGSRMQDNHHKRQSAVGEKRDKQDPIYMIPLLKSEKSLQDLLDDYVIFSEW